MLDMMVHKGERERGFGGMGGLGKGGGGLIGGGLGNGGVGGGRGQKVPNVLPGLGVKDVGSFEYV